MSIQTQALPAVFCRFTEAEIKKVFECLKAERGRLSQAKEEDKFIVATGRVCKSWRDEPVLKKERQEAELRLRQRIRQRIVHRDLLLLGPYPKSLIRIFRNCHFPIEQLPILDLGERVLQPKEMVDCPVKRFKDRYGRHGVALNIQANIALSRSFALSRVFHQMKYGLKALELAPIIRSMKGLGHLLANWGTTHKDVLAIFQRSTDDGSPWSHRFDSRIKEVYQKRHYRDGHPPGLLLSCENCPFTGTNFGEGVLPSLLKGEDPDFTLPELHGKKK